jgi:hypothetical protein
MCVRSSLMRSLSRANEVLPAFRGELGDAVKPARIELRAEVVLEEVFARDTVAFRSSTSSRVSPRVQLHARIGMKLGDSRSGQKKWPQLAHEESESGSSRRVERVWEGESVKSRAGRMRSDFDLRQTQRPYLSLSPTLLPVFGLTKCIKPHARQVMPVKTSSAPSDLSSSGAQPCTR